MKTITTELMEETTMRGSYGRGMISQERRAKLLVDYAASGLSMAAFAKREGLRYPTFVSWVKRGDGKELGQVSARRPQFAEVRFPSVPTSGAELSVTLADGLILRGVDPVGLATLVRALLVDRS